jgi:hypothetical protein
VRPKGISKLIKFKYLTWSRTNEVPVCSIVFQPLRYRVIPPDGGNRFSFRNSLILRTKAYIREDDKGGLTEQVNKRIPLKLPGF